MLQLIHPDLAYAHAQQRHAELLAEAASARRASQLPARPSQPPTRFPRLPRPAWLRPRTPAPASSTP
jgi:hypothetical protein